jgi:O-antigen/teichoic acid export membrane protein
LPLPTAKRLLEIQAALAGGAILLWKSWGPSDERIGSGSEFAAIWFGVAIVATVSYSMVRGLSLAYRPPRQFAFFTAAPAITLLGCVVLTSILASEWRAPAADVALMFAVSYGVCALAGYHWLLPHSRAERQAPIFPWVRQLIPYGSAAWLASTIQAACTFTALQWILWRAGGIEAAGAFSAGMALVLIAITPVNLIVPILFKYWMEASARVQRREFAEIAIIVTCGAAAIALVMAFRGEDVVGLMFGVAYIPYAPIFLVLCLSIVPQSLVRLGSVLCNAAGRPALAVGLESFRFVALGSGLFLAGSSPHRVAWIWLGADLATLAVGAAIMATVKLDRTRG